MNSLFKALALVAMAAMLFGCASSPSAHTARPLDPSHCRITFTRGGSMLGAAVKHYVLDDGPGNRKTALVVQKKEFPPDAGNFDKARNVTSLECDITTNIFASKIPFKRYPPVAFYSKQAKDTNPVEENAAVLAAFETHRSPEALGFEEVTRAQYLSDRDEDGKRLPQGQGYQTGFFFNNQRGIAKQHLILWGERKKGVRERNADYLGTVGSGGTITWDRPPGTLRLMVVTEGGDQAFSPAFQVVAGKSYDVEYSYARAKFTIEEK